MPRKKIERSAEALTDLRRTSGWWLGAWRQYRGLSLDDIAAETEIKKSTLSELENGSVRKNGHKPRFNRDHLPLLCKALGITEGMLFDVNPFEANPDWLAQYDALRPTSGAQGALQLVDSLPTRRRA